MGKKIISGLLSVLMIAVIVGLFFIQQHQKAQTAEQLEQINAEIQQLKSEKAELEEQRTAIQNGEDASAVVSNYRALLCLSTINEQTYTDVYPLLKEQGITGVLVLRNGQLPGDSYTVNSKQFTEMIQDGWLAGISLPREEYQTEEEWKEALQQYSLQLQERAGAVPTVYSLPEGTLTRSECEILGEEGFDTVLYHERIDRKKRAGIEIIQMTPYAQPDLETSLSMVSGYCGLDLWVGWTDETEEPLRYSPEGLDALLQSDTIQLTTLDALTPVASYSNESDIDERIAEIDSQIDELYR